MPPLSLGWGKYGLSEIDPEQRGLEPDHGTSSVVLKRQSIFTNYDRLGMSSHCESEIWRKTYAIYKTGNWLQIYLVEFFKLNSIHVILLYVINIKMHANIITSHSYLFVIF